MHSLTRDTAETYAAIALGHVSREYPNHLMHCFTGPDDGDTPRALHPVFFGSFDWHSCVHGFWLLARCLRRFPDLPSGPAIVALFDDSFTEAKIAAEKAYFERPSARGYERPYGWAWLLKLAAELEGLEPRWAKAVDPLAQAMVERYRAFLPIATYPIRNGSHSNTAFALRLAADYAEAIEDEAFEALLAETAWRWYGADAGCQAWEPSGDDFLSPALVEAECLRRLLPTGDFAAWFADFLPRLDGGEPATLFRPAVSSDRSDGKLAHLDGLNLSRAWCWRALAETLPENHPAGPRITQGIEAHLDASLPHVATDYMGEHWLATFAALALDGA